MPPFFPVCKPVIKALRYVCDILTFVIPYVWTFLNMSYLKKIFHHRKLKYMRTMIMLHYLWQYIMCTIVCNHFVGSRLTVVPMTKANNAPLAIINGYTM